SAAVGEGRVAEHALRCEDRTQQRDRFVVCSYTADEEHLERFLRAVACEDRRSCGSGRSHSDTDAGKKMILNIPGRTPERCDLRLERCKDKAHHSFARRERFTVVLSPISPAISSIRASALWAHASRLSLFPIRFPFASLTGLSR